MTGICEKMQSSIPTILGLLENFQNGVKDQNLCIIENCILSLANLVTNATVRDYLLEKQILR